jgi:DNA-directed RNA polymerase specialized sigma24 family protein
METKTDKTPDDPDSFDRQIQRPELRTRLINLARRKGVPEADCEDVASDIIAEAIRCQAGYDRQRGSVPTWTIAIGENVIRTRVRSLNAQKRKPEGGIISSNAASDPDANPLEVRDTRVEAERRSSEEAEHFLDTASLSEKEKMAVEFRLGKDVGGDFTSSTAHRAFQKLRQARDDEKFREQQADPRLFECAYGTIPAAEHNIAFLYDVLRQSGWFIDAVNRWRKSTEWKEIAIQLEKDRKSGRFPLTILPRYWPEELHGYYRRAHERNPDLRRRFEGAVRIALAISDWPILSYCRLDPTKRRHQLEEFGLMFEKEPLWEINERTFEIVVDAVEPQTPKKLSEFLEMINKAPQNGSETYNSVHIVRVDWRFPLKSIMSSFEKWAAGQKVQRLGIPKIQPAGRPRHRLLLGYAFGRLTSEFGLPKGAALSWLKEKYGRPVPKSPERIYRAARHAEDKLKDFLPTPAEIGR